MPAGPFREDRSLSPGTESEEHPKPKKMADRLRNRFIKASPLFTINLAWFLLSLPIVTIFPALGGLYCSVLSFSRDEKPGWVSMWEATKQHWWLSSKWGLSALLGYAVLGSALWYFKGVDQNWAIYASAAAGAFLLLWTAVSQFSLPLLFLQQEKKVWVAIRNGYVLTIRRPLNALKTLLLTALIAALGTLLAPTWVFITMALIAHIQTKAVLGAVENIRTQDADSDAADAHREGKSEEK